LIVALVLYGDVFWWGRFESDVNELQATHDKKEIEDSNKSMAI
jgi:hypothetical protein